MKLSLTVNEPPNGVAFRSTDLVEGHVDLELEENLEKPNICVFLEGNLLSKYELNAQVF